MCPQCRSYTTEHGSPHSGMRTYFLLQYERRPVNNHRPAEIDVTAGTIAIQIAERWALDRGVGVKKVVGAGLAEIQVGGGSRGSILPIWLGGRRPLPRWLLVVGL